MAVDALDPGPNGDYPYFPRDPATGAPLWSDTSSTDGVPVNGRTPMPRGLRTQNGVPVDLTPRRPDGSAIAPPTIPPAA